MYLLALIKNFLRRIKRKNLPIRPPVPDLSETRQENAHPIWQVKEPQKGNKGDGNCNSGTGSAKNGGSNVGIGAVRCPYCSGKNFIKSGKRKKKYEVQQRYLCNDCKRLFVAQNVKGKSFPLKLILEGLSYYNTGFTMADTCAYLKEKFGIEVKDSTPDNPDRASLPPSGL